MMSYIKLLFKKDIIEGVSSFKKGKKDILGVISSLLLLTVLYSVFIFVFNHFAKMYVGTDFGNELARESRVMEILTMGFGIIFVVNVILGVRKIYNILVNGKDNDVLVYQPIDEGAIYIYKLLKVYFSQVISTLLITLPISIIVDLVSLIVGGFVYYLLVFIAVLLLPLISCAFAAIFSIPYISIQRKLSSKYWLVLIIYVVFIGLAFWLYGSFLNVLSDLMRTGNIKYVFDLQTINGIHKISKYLYPSKFFTNILLNNHILFNVIAIIAISFVAVTISYFIIKNIFKNIIQNKLEGNQVTYKKKISVKNHNSTFALLYKEFLVVLRTPTYAFQYFAMSISLPFMVYVCAFLLESMVETLTIINCNYALAILVVSMFSILTNTFCTTNISRDGKMFAMLKTMPITVNKIVSVKVIFCSLVSFVSVFISSIVLLITGYLNFLYFLITFVVGFLFSLVQIAYATRKDMRNPSVSHEDEITESNSNMSTLILTGLLTTIFAGGGSVLLSIVLGMKYNETIASIVSLGFVFLITIIAFILSFVYLFKGLKEEYYISEI